MMIVCRAAKQVMHRLSFSGSREVRGDRLYHADCPRNRKDIYSVREHFLRTAVPGTPVLMPKVCCPRTAKAKPVLMGDRAHGSRVARYARYGSINRRASHDVCGFGKLPKKVAAPKTSKHCRDWSGPSYRPNYNGIMCFQADLRLNSDRLSSERALPGT